MAEHSRSDTEATNHCDTQQSGTNESIPTTLSRRKIAQGLAVCGCALVAARLSTSASLADDSSATLNPGDRFALEPDKGSPVAIKFEDLKPGQAIFGAYPLDPKSGALRSDSRFNMVNLVRLDGDLKGDLAKSQGVAVFSAICTHKGCAITSWQPDVRHWRCFCHMSEFDAAAKGDRVDGPATEPLPIVPVAIDADGYVTASAGFSAPPGAKS